MTVAKTHPLRLPLWIIALLLLTTLALYPVVAHEFLYYDDFVNVKDNPRMNPPRWDRVGLYWKKPFIGMYVPVTYTTWTLIAEVARTTDPDPDGNYLNPYVFHAANLLMHELTVLVVFWLLLDLVNNSLAAGLGALLFAIHPMQVEPVAWVTGFRDMLGGFFSGVALWQYLRWARGSPAGAWNYATATLAFVLAMLSKTAALPVPVIALILDALILRRGWIRPLKSLWPWMMVAIAGAVMLKFAQPESDIAPSLLLPQRLWVALDSLGFYICKFAWPAMLVPDYARTPATTLASSGTLTIVGMAMLVTLGICFWKRWRLAAAAMAVFVAGLLPVLGLVPFDYQEHSTVADRYIYLSMLAPAIAVAMIYARRPRIAIAVLLGAVYGVLGILANRQARIWQDNASFLEYVAQRSPDSWMAHNNLCKLYLAQGQIDRAYAEIQISERLKPTNPTVHINLACVWQAKGDAAGELAEFREAARLAPRELSCQRHLAVALSEQGQFAEAEKYFRIARTLAPDDRTTRRDYAEHLRRMGKAPP